MSGHETSASICGMHKPDVTQKKLPIKTRKTANFVWKQGSPAPYDFHNLYLGGVCKKMGYLFEGQPHCSPVKKKVQGSI